MRKIRNYTPATRPLTAQRRLLLELIRQSDGHVDAKELHRRASGSRSISLATVYRNLRLFQELGLIEERRLGGPGQRYELRGPTEHQHFICRDCGRVIEFQDSLIGDLVRSAQAQQGFSVSRAELYLEGHCRRCLGGGGR